MITDVNLSDSTEELIIANNIWNFFQRPRGIYIKDEWPFIHIRDVFRRCYQPFDMD